MALQALPSSLPGVAIIAVSVWLYTQLSMPLFTALVACIASFMVFNDLDSGGNMSALLRMAANSIDKIEAAMNLPVMDINGKEITPAKTDIAVRNVDFSYDKRKIIDGVTVDIPARSSLAIVGGSGSGKTTLCNSSCGSGMLIREASPSAGTMCANINWTVCSKITAWCSRTCTCSTIRSRTTSVSESRTRAWRK